MATDFGYGSGFLIDPSGLVLTANHVVAAVESAEITLYDGTVLSVEVLGRHLGADVALLKIDSVPDGYDILPLGESGGLEKGDAVIKLGYGATSGVEASTATGIVSAFLEHERFGVQLIQTDAALNPGDSGGPILDRLGRVIGVSTAKLVGIAVEGVGYAVAINEVKQRIDYLREGGIVCQQIEELQYSNTVRSKDFGYAISRWRGGWKDVVLEDGTVVLYEDKPDSAPATSPYPFTVWVWVHPPSARGSYDSGLDILQDLLGEEPGERIALREPIPTCIFEGILAWEVDNTFELETITYIGRTVVFIHGATAFILEGYAWSIRWEDSKAKIDGTIYSFRFESP
ncbi:MAG: S1C family serine protease [Dehalococcoidia bacterium]